MNKKVVLVVVVVQFFFLTSLEVTAFEPWGLPASDGSSIQPFITSFSTGKDFRIPQDSTTISQDEFYVYLEWHGSQTSREFIMQIYKEMERTIIIGDNEETEPYWELYSENTIEMIKGSNDWHDGRFSLILIDSNLIPEFTKADRKEKVIILYREVEVTFFHKTSFSQYEQIKTTAQWNMEWLLLGAWALFLSFIAGAASRYILHKVTYVPDLPPFYFWILIFISIFGATAAFFLLSGYNLDDIALMLGLMPAPLLLVAGSLYLAFWLASIFRPAKLRELAFIILDQPKLQEVKDGTRKLKNETELFTDIEILEGYLNADGEYEFINEPQSYWEMFRRAKMGGIKLDMAKLADKIPIRQKKKNYDDIIYCDKFEKKDIEVKIRENALFSLSSIIIILGIITWVAPLILEFPNVMLAILGTVFITMGVLFFFWENVVITSPFVDIIPIKGRDAIDIIRDKLTVDMKDEEIAELEMDLYKEKANVSKRARQQTKTALEEAERAHMPHMEERERTEDIAELPPKVEEALKDWIENWDKELVTRPDKKDKDNRGSKVTPS